MELTQQQVAKMQAQGLSLPQIESIARQKGDSLPQQRDFLDKVGSVFNKVFPGQQVGQAIGTLGGYGLTKASEATGLPIAPGGGRFGFHTAQKGESQNYDLSAPTPLQVAGDVAQGAAMVAGAKLPGASTILGKTAQFGALGAVSAGGAAVAQGKPTQEVAKDVGKGLAKGALTGLTFGVIEKGVRGLGNAVGKTGEKIQMGVIRPSQSDLADGFKIDTLKKYNLGGSLQDTMHKTDAQLERLSEELNQKLASSNASINMNTVFKNAQNRIFGEKFAGFGSNTKLSNAAEQLRQELLYSAGPNGLVSVPEAQIIKRASGQYGAWQYGAQDPEAKASERVYNIFYNELKKEIERSSPEGVREINKKMSELIPVMHAVIRRIPVAERNRGLSLTDMITLVGGTFNPSALALTGVNFAQKSGKVGNLLSKGTGAGQAVSNAIQRVERGVRTFQQSGR